MLGETPAIELIEVSTALAGRWVLDGVSFGVEENRITVMLGPSGAGKTTCLRHVTGLLAPNHGDVLVEGRSRTGMRQRELAELQRRFGVVFQGSGLHGSALFESLTVFENVAAQLRAKLYPELAGGQLRGHLDRMPEAIEAEARERLAEVGMLAYAEALPEELSAGMRRRVALARALAGDPDFLVVDGLESGLDGVRLMRICELLRRRQARLGGTYLIVTHDIEAARLLADRIVVIWDGAVIAEGPAGEVFAEATPEVRQLLSAGRQGPLALRDAPLAPRPAASAAAVRGGPSVGAIVLLTLVVALLALLTLVLFVDGSA